MIETKSKKTKKLLSITVKAVNTTTTQNPILNKKGKPLIMGVGACTVAGCGCTQYSDYGDNRDICTSLNSAGGTCNHSKDLHK